MNNKRPPHIEYITYSTIGQRFVQCCVELCSACFADEQFLSANHSEVKLIENRIRVVVVLIGAWPATSHVEAVFIYAALIAEGRM